MIQNKILNIFRKAKAAGREKAVRQMEFDRVYKFQLHEFREQMHMQGFRYIAAGMYGSVWEKGGILYKINSGASGEYDGFLCWVNACKGLDNPHLPKFGGIGFDGGRYCVELEPLESLSSKNYHELTGGVHNNIAYSDDLVEYAAFTPKFKQAIELAYRVMVASNDASKFPAMTDDLDIWTMVQWLDVSGARNIMARPGTGDLILNDPVPYSSRNLSGLVELMQCAA